MAAMGSDATSVLNKNKKLEYIIDYCRVCMIRRNEDMISIFDSQGDNILGRIQFCTGVEFKKEDGLPTHICNNCTQNLTVAHKFKTSCLESENVLRKIFQECIKVEPEDLNNFLNHYDDGDHDGDTEFSNVSNENVSKSMELKHEVENVRRSVDYEDEVLEKVSKENVSKSMQLKHEVENVRRSVDYEDEVLEKVSNENVSKSMELKHEVENVRRSVDYEDEVLEKVSNENVRKPMNFEDEALEKVSYENVGKYMDFEDEVLEKVPNENVRKSMNFEDEALEKVSNENVGKSMDFEDEVLEKVPNEYVRKSMNFEDEAVENISNENVRITRARVKTNDSTQNKYLEIKTGKEIEKEIPKIIRKPNKKSTVEKETDKKTRRYIEKEKKGPKTIRGPYKKGTVEKEIEKEKARPKIMRGSYKKSNQTNITPIELDRLQCEPCNLKFKSKAESIKHMKMVHKNKKQISRCVCEICGKITKRWDVHMLSHQPPKYECAHCDYKTSKKGLIGLHVQRHGEKRFRCELCSRHYPFKRELDKHILFYHDGVKKFQCDICDKRFPRRTDLRIHYRSHSEKRFECEVCHKRITSRNYLRIHLRKYHGVELPIVRQCGPKVYALNDETDVITKSTEGEKRYQCEFCPRSYTTFSHLDCHIRICHEAGKKPECNICNKQFVNRDALRTHMDIHDESKRIECEICHNTFSRRAFWRLHLRRQHGLKAPVPSCPRRLSPREEMALLLSNNTGAIAKSHAKQTLATDN